MSEKTDYDRAIEAYRFQVERYHTWMNYYSLFHGALLIALYSVADLCAAKEKDFLFLLIAFLGYVTGLCWLGTVIGNRKWIGSWIQNVQSEEREDSKRKENSSRHPIYNRLYTNRSTKGFLSTQKIMQLFTGFVTLAWLSVVLAYSIPCSPLLSGDYPCYRCIFLVLSGIVFAVAIILYYSESPFIYSDTTHMERL